MKNRVNVKREKKIVKASQQNNWTLVDHLLNQPYENPQRKDRKYKIISLNKQSSYKENAGELIDFIYDDTNDPLEQLIIKERNELIAESLANLSQKDLNIVIGRIMHNQSFLELARQSGISNKTAKVHFQNSLNTLKKQLEKSI